MTALVARAQESRSERFVRNVGASVAAQAGLMALSFFLTPVLIRALGVQTYGLYVLFQASVGYVILGCLGAGSATVKFVAEAAASGGRAMRLAVRYCGGLHFFGALAGAAVLAAFARPCAQHLFHVPPPMLGPAVFVLRCAAAGAVFVALNQGAAAILQGLQRFDWQNAATLLQSGVMIVGSTVLAVKGFGIDGVARWYVLWSACALIFAVFVTRRQLLAKWRGDGAELKFSRFLTYGLSVWNGAFAGIVTFQFDRLFIARAQSLSALTYYAVPANLLQRLQFFPAVINSVMLPMFVEIGAGDDETVRRVYLRGTRSLLFMILPVLVLLFCVMPQFLSLWVGGDFSLSAAWPARLLVAAQAALLFNYIPNAAVAGRGQPLHQAAVSWAQAIISLVAWSLLIGRLGLLGVALGSLLAQLIPACVYVTATNRGLLKLPLSRYLDEGLLRPLACAGVLLALVFPFHAEASTWPRLLGLCSAGGALYAGLCWFVMDAGDKDIFRRLVLRRAA